jgi:hypothetical protein
MKLRKETSTKGKSARSQKNKSHGEDDNNLVTLPSPSIAPV